MAVIIALHICCAGGRYGRPWGFYLGIYGSVFTTGTGLSLSLSLSLS
eukprot:COSAG03_NODE_18924_length_345_cov_3.475610_2_plen_46_part_01